jgi:hypothetical protein
MLEKTTPVQAEEACEDLKNRTLVSLPGCFGRLIYLASMRDYNTGQYYHDGLAKRFSEATAADALAKCHREAFQLLLRSPLEEVVGELERYIGSTPAEADQLLDTWERLQPYRIAVPAQSSPVLAEFFTSNIKIALAILKYRRSKNS